MRSSWFLQPSRAFYQYQPLGVVGVIGAWNYQLLLTLGPVVDAIAAGNHVMLKPSEITPRSAEVIRSIVAEAFPPEYVTCVTGGPELAGNADYTRIVRARHLERLRALADDAAAKGARVVRLAGDAAPSAPDDRIVPPTLIFDPTDDMQVMREEIFGPLLPVVASGTLDEALAYVNARPRPLALYYFDEDAARIDDVLARTMSGGVTVNDTVLHLGQHNLPFGGVGPSGMGHYHGFDGFVTFSKTRGVMVQSRLAATTLFHAPYRGRARALIERLLRLALR